MYRLHVVYVCVETRLGGVVRSIWPVRSANRWENPSSPPTCSEDKLGEEEDSLKLVVSVTILIGSTTKPPIVVCKLSVRRQVTTSCTSVKESYDVPSTPKFLSKASGPARFPGGSSSHSEAANRIDKFNHIATCKVYVRALSNSRELQALVSGTYSKSFLG